MKPRILLLGNTGQLGWELDRTLRIHGEVTAVDYPEINYLELDSLREFVLRVRPDIIYNAVAYTAVDRAETEKDFARSVNEAGPKLLAELAKQMGSILIHYSTDYVFDGNKGKPYQEEDDVCPINVYGKTKLEGERAVQRVGGDYLIFRTSCVYSLRRDSFVTKVLSWSRKHEVIRIVSDQVGNPTWARMLAEISSQILGGLDSKDVKDWLREKSGLYHLAGDGMASRYDWAKSILEHDLQKGEQVVKDVLPAKSEEFSTAAERPKLSALDCTRFKTVFGVALPDWKTALKLAMES